VSNIPAASTFELTVHALRERSIDPTSKVTLGRCDPRRRPQLIDVRHRHDFTEWHDPRLRYSDRCRSPTRRSRSRAVNMDEAFVSRRPSLDPRLARHRTFAPRSTQYESGSDGGKRYRMSRQGRRHRIRRDGSSLSWEATSIVRSVDGAVIENNTLTWRRERRSPGQPAIVIDADQGSTTTSVLITVTRQTNGIGAEASLSLPRRTSSRSDHHGDH